MYRLFAAPGHASMAPEAILEQIGTAYEYVHLAPMAARKDASYRKLNPLGQIPTLIDGDLALHESAAICLHLCDRHPEAGLLPPPGTPGRARCYQWLFFLSNTLQPAYMTYFYPDRYITDPQCAPRMQRDAEPRIATYLGQLDGALAATPFLGGSEPSASDIYLHMLVTWHRADIIALDRLPNLQRAVAAVEELPGVATMMMRNRGH